MAGNGSVFCNHSLVAVRLIFFLLPSLLVLKPVLILLQHLARQVGHGLCHGLLGAFLRPQFIDGVVSDRCADALAQGMPVLVDSSVAYGIIAEDLDDLTAARIF